MHGCASSMSCQERPHVSWKDEKALNRIPIISTSRRFISIRRPPQVEPPAVIEIAHFMKADKFGDAGP